MMVMMMLLRLDDGDDDAAATLCGVFVCSGQMKAADLGLF